MATLNLTANDLTAATFSTAMNREDAFATPESRSKVLEFFLSFMHLYRAGLIDMDEWNEYTDICREWYAEMKARTTKYQLTKKAQRAYARLTLPMRIYNRVWKDGKTFTTTPRKRIF